MDVSDNFKLQEFVHPAIFGQWRERCVDFLHPELVNTCQLLREQINSPIRINNWHIGGLYESSGLRLPTGSVGGMLSKHKFGVAVDMKFPHISTDEVFGLIMSHPALYQNILRIENVNSTRSKYGSLGKDWFHLEVGAKREPGVDIYVFKP